MTKEDGSTITRLSEVRRVIVDALAPYRHELVPVKFPNLKTLKSSFSLYNHGDYFHPRTLEFFGIHKITLERPSVTVETADIGFYAEDILIHKVILWVWDSVLLSLKPISLTRFESRGDALVFAHYVQKIMDGEYALDGYISPLAASEYPAAVCRLPRL